MTWVDLIPFRTPLVAGQNIEPITWLKWLTRLVGVANRTPQVLASVSATAQAASIGSTDVPLSGALPEGLARLTYALRITRAAGTSSSAQVTFNWTDGGVGQSATFTAVTGNTTTTTQGEMLPFHTDAGAVPSYSVAYGSVGAPTMQFSLTLAIEAMP